MLDARLLIAPFLLQGVLMFLDEFRFHRGRGLSRWERIGHPLDTLTVLICLGWVLVLPPEPTARWVYVGLCVFSCAFITKDEWVHARDCTPMEHWLHAVLFILHPILLAMVGYAWIGHLELTAVRLQAAVILAFGLYQTLYWNLLWKPNLST